MSCIVFTVKTVIYDSMFVEPNPAIYSGNQESVAVLAYLSPDFRRQPYFILHGNPPSHFHIFVR